MVTVRSVTRERAFVCILLDTGERFWLRGDDLYGSDITEGASFDAGAFLQKIRVLQYPRALNHAVASEESGSVLPTIAFEDNTIEMEAVRFTVLSSGTMDIDGMNGPTVEDAIMLYNFITYNGITNPNRVTVSRLTSGIDDKTKVDVSGPEATPPESKAIPEKREGLKSSRSIAIA